MVGKIINIFILLIVALLIFCAASIAGVRNDDKKAKQAAEEKAAEEAAAAAAPKEVKSPYEPYTGDGVLELQMDYEVQLSGDDVLVSVVTNLPDGYDLTAELSNVEEVKAQLGFGDISASALTPEQLNSINEQTYNSKQKNFVTNGVSDFTFKSPPSGQLDLKITSPITKLQRSSVQELLGDAGANLQGSYVVFLEEVGDKSINFNASFVLDETGGEASPVENAPQEGEPAEEAPIEDTPVEEAPSPEVPAE